MGFFDKLKQGLTKTKESINDKINNVFSNFRKVDEELLEELEEALIMSDMGVETSTQIISNLREKIGRPDLMILFTNTVCHKMIVTATQTAGKNNIEIARSHSSSATALKKILSQYCGC